MRPAALGLLLLGALSSAPALATTLTHLDTRALTRSSQEIVIGTVVETRSHWNSAHTRIVTEIDVDVRETIKGSPATRVTLTQMGGEVDGVRVSVPGCAAFHPGEEALLFVWRDPHGRAQLTGLAQGKFEIERDRATGTAYVQRWEPGFAVKDLVHLESPATGGAPRTLRLDALVREIRTSMRSEKP